MTIQVFLPVGGENGILVKNYLKIPISPLEVFLPKYQKLHLKSERFKIKKIEVEKMVWLFQVEKMGSPGMSYVKWIVKSIYCNFRFLNTFHKLVEFDHGQKPYDRKAQKEYWYLGDSTNKKILQFLGRCSLLAKSTVRRSLDDPSIPLKGSPSENQF